MKCSVCSNEIHKNYCSNCGQYFKNERITGSSLLKDLFGAVFSLERSFFENIKIGLLRPKRLVTNYWNGFRGYYYSPSKFLVLASLFFLIQIMLGNDFLGIWVASKVSQQFTLLIVNIVLFTIISYIVYLKYGNSFYEHLVLNIYNVSLWSIIFVPISLVLNVLNTHKTIKTGFLFLLLLLIIIWNARVFEMKNRKRFLYIALNCVFLVLFILLIYKLSTIA